jgi:hypothetical protein
MLSTFEKTIDELKGETSSNSKLLRMLHEKVYSVQAENVQIRKKLGVSNYVGRIRRNRSNSWSSSDNPEVPIVNVASSPDKDINLRSIL